VRRRSWKSRWKEKEGTWDITVLSDIRTSLIGIRDLR
jgi:hypothetical protein